MGRGKSTNLDVATYRELKGQGLSRQAIAERLGLDPTAISKFVSRHRKELEEAGVDVSYSGKPPDAEMGSDTIDQLLKMNLALTNQIERIAKDIEKASPKEATKLIEVLVKCLSESRQQHLALQNIKSILNDQKTIFEFFSGVTDAICAEVPKDIRLRIFGRIWP